VDSDRGRLAARAVRDIGGRGSLQNKIPVGGGRVSVVEDKRPLCQSSSKRLEDNWHSGRLSSTFRHYASCPLRA